MTASRHPPIGAFLRPIGAYEYCLRVLAVRGKSADAAHEIVEAERWGVDHDTPVRDGHQHQTQLRDLREIRPGVWCSTYRNPSWSDWVLREYAQEYRLMSEPPQPTRTTASQMALF
jgi:hypothetical protein